MRNIEIKAKVRNLAQLIESAKKISDTKCQIIKQHDTFFKSNSGRLKLRQFEDETGELIYYERSDAEGPKLSDYDKCTLGKDSVVDLKKVLNRALGSIGEVKKERHLYMVGNTRVHIDSVCGLGDFMELEVGLEPHQSDEEGQKIAYDLMEKLGVSQEDLISGAYTDLLKQQG